MINKLYDKIKNILKENYKLLIIMLVTFLVFTVKFPYYIEAPGGLIDVAERITMDNRYEMKGTLNLAYVLEFKATLPTLIYARFSDDWDVYKKEDIIASNETAEDIKYRDHLLLEEANQNALYIGFTKANREVSIENQKVFVFYIDSLANTNLKIGDEIVEINNKKVYNKIDVYNVLKELKINEAIILKVKRDNKIIECRAEIQEIADRPAIGIMLAETKEVTTNPKVTLNFQKSESGPSGGFMMALAIYNYLTEEDITKGLNIVGTGTIDMDGKVGAIGGVEYKVKAAEKEKADIFFVPSDNYEEALKVIKENKYKITLVEVKTINDAIKYLMELN